MASSDRARPAPNWRQGTRTRQDKATLDARRRRRIATLVILLAAASGAAAYLLSLMKAAAPTAIAVVGFTDYAEPRADDPTARADRHALRAWLGSARSGFILVEQDRDRSAWEQTKSWLKSAPRDRPAVVYISGAARRVRTARGPEVQIARTSDAPLGKDPWLPLSEVFGALKSCPAPRKLLVLDIMRPWADASLGVPADDAAEGVLAMAKAAFQGDGKLAILTACAPGEVSLPSEVWGRSAFSVYFERALQADAGVADAEGNGDGNVSAEELARYVRDRVENWALTTRGASQRPTLLLPAKEGPALALLVVPKTARIPRAVQKAAEGEAKPRATEPPRAADPYPRWLTRGWALRDGWRDRRFDVIAPRTFRRLEAELLRAESAWRLGDPDAEARYRLRELRITKEEPAWSLPRLDPMSLGLARESGALVDAFQESLGPLAEALNRQLDEWAKAKAKGEKADGMAEKLGKLLPKPDPPHRAEVARAILEAAGTSGADFPALYAEKLKLLDQAFQAWGQDIQDLHFAETLALHRLAAAATGGAPPDAETLRLALLVARDGEAVDAHTGLFARFRREILQAAEDRHLGEVYLRGRGYVPGNAALERLKAARGAYEKILRDGMPLEAADTAQARVLLALPAYLPYLELAEGAEDRERWHAAVRACRDAIEHPDRASTGEDLQAALGALLEPFDEGALHKLVAYAAAKEARADDNATYRRLDAVLATPFPKAALRKELASAARRLALRLHGRVDARDHNSPPVARGSRGRAEERDTAVSAESERRLRERLRASDAMLGLLDEGVETAAAEDDPGRFGSERSGSASPPADAAAEDAPRELWSRRSGSTSTGRLETLARVGPLWLGRDDRLDDPASCPWRKRRLDNLGEHWWWLAGRYAYEGYDLFGLDGAGAKGDPFRDAAGLEIRRIAKDSRAWTDRDWDSGMVLRIDSTRRPDVTTLSLTAVAGSDRPAKNRVDLDVSSPVSGRFRPGLVAARDGAQAGAQTLHLELTPESAANVHVKVAVAAPGQDEPLGLEPPRGVLVTAKFDGRVYHQFVPVGGDPGAGVPLAVLLGADKNSPRPAPERLRLRPLEGPQDYDLFIKNGADRARKVDVEIRSGDIVLASTQKPVEAAAGATVPVTGLVAPSPLVGVSNPPTAAGASPTGAAPRPEPAPLELPGRGLVIELREAGTNAIVRRMLPIEVAAADDYARVEEASLPERGRITFRIRSDSGPQAHLSQARLQLPPHRLPSLRAGGQPAEKHLDDRQAAPGEPITLFAAGLAGAGRSDAFGSVYIDLDRYPRAWKYTTDFAGAADQDLRPDVTPAVALVVMPGPGTTAPRFQDRTAPGPYGGDVRVEQDARSDLKLRIEVDNAREGDDVVLERLFHSGDSWKVMDGTRRVDPRNPVVRLAVMPRGVLRFEAAVEDNVWTIPGKTESGWRIFRASLRTRDGRPDGTCYYDVQVIFDDAGLRKHEITDYPVRIWAKTKEVRIRAFGDAASGIKAARFFLGKRPPPEDKLPEAVEGRPMDAGGRTWAATIPLTGAETSVDVGVQFESNVGLFAYDFRQITVVQPPPPAGPKPAEPAPTGSISGTVTSAQDGRSLSMTVSAKDGRGNVVKQADSNANGQFLMEKLAPGSYTLTAGGASSGFTGTASATVEANQTARAAISVDKAPGP